MKKKFLALVLTLAMVLSLVPVTALAGNTSLLSITPDEGSFATYEFYKIKDDTSSLWYTQTVKKGGTLNRPADPTRTGYYFTGWKTADGAEVPFDTEVNVTETSTIQCYAQWEKNANPIHVYFMAAEGSKEVVYTGVAKDETVDIPEDYKDITWKTADGKAFEGKNVTNDMNVYPASASCWLTFDSQGGSAIASHYVQQGENFELSKAGEPTKAGYTFAGWSSEVNGTKQTEVTPNGDTKLFALWTPATANYTVIHWQENANDNEYSYIASEKKSGTTGTQTNATSKQYDGFEAKTITQKNINGDGSTIVNVYYQRNSYTIHFYYREYGSWKEYTDIRITAKHGADISKQWPEKKGSKTWSTTKNLSQFNGGPYQVNIETMPLGGAKYYGPKTDRGSESAHYYVEVLPGESGTVTQGGVTYKLHHTDTSPGTGYEVTQEDKYPLTGFEYNGGTRNGSSYDNARFYYTRKSYDVVYVSNGIEVKKEPYKYEQDIRGASSYIPTNAPAGYTFGGWYSDPSGTTPYEFSGKKMPAQNITVYAKWVPITLKLTIQGVDGVGSADVNYNQVINEAGVYKQATDKLTAANKTVLYWVNCETNQKVNVNSQMMTDLTIRPVLKGDTYTVTYNSGAADSQRYWYNTIAKVKNYTGDNAGKFLYWTDAANTTTKYHPGDQIQMTANVTLKPNFSGENPGQTYSVTYHSNFDPDATYKHEGIKNNAQFTIENYEGTQLPNREGYDFTDWNTQADGNGKTFEAGRSARMNGANDNDLYAQWSPSTYTLTYDANGGYFGSVNNTTTTEEMITAGNHDLLYTPAYTPNHEQTSEGKDVIFLGWSIAKKENVLTKADVNNANAIASSIITEVNIPTVQTVYAVWSLDENGNNFPDVFEATVTYEIKNGTWADDKDTKTEVIKVKELKNGVWTDTNNTLNDIPDTDDTDNVKPNKGYTKTGTWDSKPDKTTPVTANKKYTYTLSPVTTGTLTITKKVEGDGLTVDSLPENFQITVKDAQGETKGTLTKTEKAKKADGTLTWTISGLPAGEYTVSESNADVKDYTYTTTYNNVAATQDNSATVTVKKGESSTMTVTNTYTKNATVDLSQLIQKQLTVKKNSALPTGTTFGVTVTPKTVNGQPATTTQPISGTVRDLGEGTKNEETGETTYTAPFIFDTDGTLSLSAGTHTYTVQENATSPISGMQYDSNVYTLTIEVENSKASVKYTTKEGTTPTEVSTTNPLTIQNTYQAPDLTVEKKTVSVAGEPVNNNNPVAHVNEQIIWSVTVTNKSSTPARVTLTDAMAEGVYKDNECKTPAENVNWNPTAHSWTATVSGEETYYVNYTVKEADIPKGKIVNTIVMKNGDTEKKDTSDPVSTWDTKQLKSATSNLNTSDWTTTVTLELPTVSKTEQQPDPIAVKSGSYVIDQIGNEFTFVPELTLKVGKNEYTGKKGTSDANGTTYTFGSTEYKVTYTDKNNETNAPAQFKWEINQDIPAETKVTLSYKLKLANPKAAGTHGVTDLDGNGFVDGAETTKVVASDALYTNEKAALYIKEKENNQEKEIAVFPKPSVSYTVKGSSSGGHGGGTVTIPDDVPTGLNGKDHYAYVVGYPDGMVYPQKNITRAEVATIFFRLLKDETREANMTKSNGYNDMKDGAWYTCAVSTLSKMGIIKGYEDGSFKPDASISRAEFAAIAARFDPDGDKTPATFSDVSSHWAKDEISIAANHGWIKGYEDGSFKPDQKITRAETMTLVNRVLKRLPETKDDLHKDMKTWPDNQNESAWFYLAVQEATNSHYQKLKKDGTHETWESMRETRDWAALEK